MLLRQMRYFVEVVRRGSFTEAAEACFISQSAISQQIRALEQELGVDLLEREGRRFSLTRAGDYFYRQSRILLAEADKLCQDTVRVANLDQNRLRIAYPCNYAGQELQQAVAAFSVRHPKAAVQIVNGTHEELYDLLRFDGTDLVINDQRRAFSEEYVNYHLTYSDCFAEVCAQGPLAVQPSVSIDGLRRVPCILIASPGQREHEQDYYQNTLGFGRQYVFAANLEEARLMVAANRGFLPIEGGEEAPRSSGAIRRLPLTRGGQRLRRRYCAFWRKDNENPYLTLFAELLRELFPPQEIAE